MLDLRIVRGPLQPTEDQEILREYSRLTGAHIALKDFRRWVQQGPAGPAWHAILHADNSRIVGHASVIPLRAVLNGQFVCAAKAEYFFVHENYRKERIGGFQNTFLPTAALLLDQLYSHYRKQSAGPLLISARDELQPLLRLIGCSNAAFPLHECLLILDPAQAARDTPNISAKQRAAFFAVGMVQRAAWSIASHVIRNDPFTSSTPIKSKPSLHSDDRIALFEDNDSFLWRYPSDHYVQFGVDSQPDDYVIAKRSPDNGYLRVCQWSVNSTKSAGPFLRTLIGMAKEERRLGVRWAVYKNGQKSRALVRTMRQHGFICAARNRTLTFYGAKPADIAAETWKMTDSLFTFDM